jgi:hypothetical protein
VTLVYKAFGTTKPFPEDEYPVVKEEYQDTMAAWPPEELTNGVGIAQIHLHGDDPTDAFIVVCGTNKEAAVAMWKRIAFTLMNEESPLGEWWRKESSDAGAEGRQGK